MADSTGVNAATGAALTDWAHVQQSIKKILTTPIGSRVMRRDFGSDLPDLVDQKMIQRNVLAVYSAAATAIARW
ncbi:GPW/gp25 family protein, partial [Klebsiella pneumoniae]|nr:GPW/gp25 family protein [Klebsiella pneumoniae]